MTTTLVQFNLRDVVRDHLESTTETDPSKIGKAIVGSLSDAELRPALLSVVREIVQVEQGTERNNQINNIRRGDDNISVSPITGKRPRQGRPRIHSYVEYLEKFRRSTLVIDGVTKRHAECTADDFLKAAQMRRDSADALVARADFYESLADALTTAQATTLGDLTDDELAAVVKE